MARYGAWMNEEQVSQAVGAEIVDGEADFWESAIYASEAALS